MTRGESDLTTLLATLNPQLQSGRFVFTTGATVPADIDPIAIVHEDKGITVILEQGDADEHGLVYSSSFAMITLGVHSALNGVGLTAAIASVLANADISCNVIAGFYHDHLFVPYVDAHRALALLEQPCTPPEPCVVIP